MAKKEGGKNGIDRWTSNGKGVTVVKTSNGGENKNAKKGKK